MSRKVAREILYQLVFEYLFLKGVNKDTLELMLIDNNLSDDDKSYINDSYFGISGRFDGLVKEISEHIIDFKIDRIFKTDLAALIVAIYEIKTCDGIPEAVSVNEAVNLVKKFSTEKSYSYVNGVLSGYLKNLHTEDLTEPYTIELDETELDETESDTTELDDTEADETEFEETESDITVQDIEDNLE
ncbi:MAG: transcription antitermination factor NusB [Clostridiales bacterium]|jgi:N utilization substance protein B|nr:transcription antitermination factor NusB [Clostridiales bacterium]